MEATGTRLTSARCVRPLQAAAANTHNVTMLGLQEAVRFHCGDHALWGYSGLPTHSFLHSD